jgi:2-octaprenyl-6-methoxyphenol hydroxylase
MREAMTAEVQRVGVLIVGGGFTGLALALALRLALGPGFAVTVADPSFRPGAAEDARASAIAAAARRLFEAIGAWDLVTGEAQPILDMVVTDSRLADTVRPAFLSFAGEIEPGEPFAHMIENRVLVAALMTKAGESGISLVAAAVTGFEGSEQHARAQFDNGTALDARLLVAADGARSRLRSLAGIASVGWTYPQSAIVTTVAHERDHEGRAYEHFLPGGPFAILPLKGRRSSIVWTEAAETATRMLALPDEQFHDELERRFGLEFGEIRVVGPRRAHPLGYSVARSFVGERLALVGDAAHVIHPIAGQGLNMGLKDVAALAESVVDAARLGLDPGSSEVLDRYQRWRRFDTMMMGAATDGLNRLFSNRSDLLRLARDLGLGIVERLPRLKQWFIREAAGMTGEVPKLLRGEAL